MLKNWNVDEKKLRAQQDELKAKYDFQYIGHGPRATGFLSKTFKRKDNLYVRCTQCGYYMPLSKKGSEDCICGSIHRDEQNLNCDFGENEVEVFKAVQK